MRRNTQEQRTAKEDGKQGSEAVATEGTWEADLPELFNPIYSMRSNPASGACTRKTDFEYFMAESRMRRSPSVIPQIWCSYTRQLKNELFHWLSVTLTKLNESMDCPAREGRLAPALAKPSEENTAHIVVALDHLFMKLIPKLSPFFPKPNEAVPRLPQPPVLSGFEL